MFLGTCSRMKGCMSWIDVHPVTITQVGSVILIVFWLFYGVAAFLTDDDYKFFILSTVSPVLTCVVAIVCILCYLLAILALQISNTCWLYPARIVSVFSGLLGCIQIGARSFEYMKILP